MNLEERILTIIINSGNAKSLCFEALNEAKKGEMEKAKELMKDSKNEFLKAHHIQTEMIQKEASGVKTGVSLLMVHAQNHLMCTSLAMDLIEEMIEMHQSILDNKK